MTIHIVNKEVVMLINTLEQNNFNPDEYMFEALMNISKKLNKLKQVETLMDKEKTL